MNLTFVVYDGVQALDVAGPLDVFAEANRFLPADQQYKVSVVGMRSGNLRFSNGMEFSVPSDYRNFQGETDMLLVAGGPRAFDMRPEPEFLAWLNRTAQGARRFGSVCNGVFLLGEAGLLKGREITTHWNEATRLAEQFPDSTVNPDKIFVRDGNLFTCGGVAAGIDLCLSLVAEDWGHKLAIEVARQLIVYIRRDGGESQYSPYLAVGQEEGNLVEKVQKYVSENISEVLSIDEIADAVGISRRTFTRTFAKQTNITASVYVEQLRIDFARKLLEETDIPLKTVAFRCGFHNVTQMRMTFCRRLHTTPKKYRDGFRARDGLPPIWEPAMPMNGVRPPIQPAIWHSQSPQTEPAY